MKPCDWHKPHGLGYMSWFQWADEKTSKGYEQIQCEECKHWFFSEQFGKKPSKLTVSASARKDEHGFEI